MGSTGDFHVDENGDMWKGDTLNVSQRTSLADDVKAATGMEVTVFFGDTYSLGSHYIGNSAQTDQRYDYQ